MNLLRSALPWESGYLEAQRRGAPELWRPARETRAARRTRRVVHHARRDLKHPA